MAPLQHKSRIPADPKLLFSVQRSNTISRTIYCWEGETRTVKLDVKDSSLGRFMGWEKKKFPMLSKEIREKAIRHSTRRLDKSKCCDFARDSELNRTSTVERLRHSQIEVGKLIGLLVGIRGQVHPKKGDQTSGRYQIAPAQAARNPHNVFCLRRRFSKKRVWSWHLWIIPTSSRSGHVHSLNFQAPSCIAAGGCCRLYTWSKYFA